ncbi:hypothetical protein FXO38_12028 [Capsicum annuum]|nr:hypothetical protein FXO38_12028 [Capsicum annuum]
MDVELRLLEIDFKLDTVKDLLFASYFYLDKIKHTSKDIGIDIAYLCVKRDPVIKEEKKLATMIQATTDALSATIKTQFTNLKDATTHTLAYFFSRHPSATN